MRFTLKQLRYFDAVLRTGSVARAAVELNISQSSITAAIDTIEQETGAELLRRMPAKGIVPTDKGLEAGKRIRSFLEQARIFESDLLSMTGDPTGILRLACYAPTAPYVLPPILRQVSANYPSIRIELKEGDMQAISELLSAGVVDMALTYRRLTPDSQPFVPMFRAKPMALVPDTSRLAEKPQVTLADLAAEPMILLDLPGTHSYFLGMFEAAGLSPKVAHTTKSSSVLRGLVAAQFGYAMMNICGPNDRSGENGYVAKPIADALDAPQYGVAYTTASQRSSIVKTVLNTCREIAEAGEFQSLVQ
jgi:DNA-binding transcriptional LysR family regulator